MIPEGDSHLTTLLNELLVTHRQEEQSNTFRFPIVEKPCETGHHTHTDMYPPRIDQVKRKVKIEPQG